MLGRCEVRIDNATKYKTRLKCNHPMVSHVENDYASQLDQTLQPGVDKLIKENGSKKHQLQDIARVRVDFLLTLFSSHLSRFIGD